jgi:hypothetical protein
MRLHIITDSYVVRLFVSIESCVNFIILYGKKTYDGVTVPFTCVCVCVCVCVRARARVT